MKLNTATFSNIWNINGGEIDNIVIYDNLDGGRVLLDTHSQWIGWGMAGNAIRDIKEIETVRDRNSLSLAREEHFLLRYRVSPRSSTLRTLYLNAGLLLGYSTVDMQQVYADDLHSVWRRAIDLTMTVDGEAEPRTIRVYDAGPADECHETRYTARGLAAQRVASVYNEGLHYRDIITMNGAARLMDLLPALAEAAEVE